MNWRFSKILRRTAFILCCTLAVAGCGSSKGPDNGLPADAKSSSGTASEVPSGENEIVIAMLPKLTTIAYFEACRVGAEQAVADLNAGGVKVKLI